MTLNSLTVIEAPNPILKQKAEAVKDIEPWMAKLALEMLKTMREGQGIGLAAPQVGKLIRLIVIDTKQVDPDKGIVKVMFNPRILDKSGLIEIEEGCLSFPGKTVKVGRASKIKVNYNLPSGRNYTEILEGLNAVVVQQQIEHLSGTYNYGT